jgi:hypothetical protein
MFGQSGLTIVAPVYTNSVDELRALLEQIGQDPAGNSILPLGALAPLHYASLTLLPIKDKQRLVIEANFDGDADQFLNQLIESQTAGVDALFSHCPGYEPEDRYSYLKAHDLGTGAFYVGCPGRTVDQIFAERELRKSIEQFLGVEPQAPSERTKVLEFVKQSPALKFALEPYTRPWLVRFGSVTLISIVLAVLAVIVVLAYERIIPPDAFIWVGCAALGAVCFLLISEMLDRPFPNARYAPKVEEIVDGEDFGSNNHMVSVTQIKPGIFRALLIRVVLFVVTYLVRFNCNKGNLSGISSIHFARWVIVERNTLVFFSNFGGSWDSYLNDFIDLAAAGLTGVWSNSIGFPKTRLLIFDGARQGLAFKVFARNSMSPTLAWYQAYPSLSTINIENNTRIREGLISSDAAGEGKWIERL